MPHANYTPQQKGQQHQPQQRFPPVNWGRQRGLVLRGEESGREVRQRVGGEGEVAAGAHLQYGLEPVVGLAHPWQGFLKTVGAPLPGTERHIDSFAAAVVSDDRNP